LILRLISLLTPLVFCSCAIPFKSTGVSTSYDFSRVKNIGAYVVPSGRDTLDLTYRNLLKYDLMSRGYRVVDLNERLEELSIHLEWNGHIETAETLYSVCGIHDLDLITVARMEWEELPVFWDIRRFDWGVMFKSGVVPTVVTEFLMTEPRSRKAAVAISRRDTMRVMSSAERHDSYASPFRFLFQASLSKIFREFPLCRYDLSPLPDIILPVIFYVDNSYQEAFPFDWKERLQRRLLYVNDVYLHSTGIGFRLAGLETWNSWFGTSLEDELVEVEEFAKTRDSVIVIGVTFNQQMLSSWMDWHNLGIARVASNYCVVQAIPSTRERGSWNSLEEALVQSHELGHVLGSPHILDIRSLLFPDASCMSMELDRFSRAIISRTAEGFPAHTSVERERLYIGNLASVYRAYPTPMVTIVKDLVAHCALVAMSLEPDPSISETALLSTLVDSLVPDAALRSACLGVISLELGEHERATFYLRKSVSIDHGLAEAYEYLGEAYEAAGNADSALIVRRVAARLGRQVDTTSATMVYSRPGDGDYIRVDTKPQIIQKVSPIYPDEARRRAIQGTIWVSILVGKDGTPQQTVVFSSDQKALENASIEAAEGCRFVPAFLDGEPVNCWVRIPFVFSLAPRD